MNSLHCGFCGAEVPYTLTPMRIAESEVRKVLDELGGMRLPPASAEEREYYGRVLWAWIENTFAATLAAAEVATYRTSVADPGKTEGREVLRKLGAFVCDKCEQWGDWRLSLCADVLRMKAWWELHDPDMKERYRAADQTHDSVVWKRGRLSVPPKQFQMALDACTPPMALLIDRFRDRRSAVKRSPTNGEMADFFVRELECEEARILEGDAHKIVNYIRNHPDSRFASNVLLGRIEAEGFLAGLMSDGTGYSVRSIQDKVKKARESGR